MSQNEEKDRQEEAKEVDEAAGEPKSSELSEKDLKGVAGGAFPTSVNDQITD